MLYTLVWSLLLYFVAGQDPFVKIYNLILNNSSSYNPYTPPWMVHGRSIDVVINNYFTVLISVEENKQVVKYITNFNITWNDPRLIWDPLEMGTDNITVPPSVPMYRPDFIMYNALNAKEIAEQWAASTLQVHCQGSVSLVVYSLIESVCPINVESFPFDHQYCYLAFSSVFTSIDLLRIKPNGSVQLTAGIPEWELEETFAFTSNFTQGLIGLTYPLGQVVYHLKRNPQFYIFFMILPTYVVTSLCIGAVLLPIKLELGERINLGIAGLLGLTFLLSVIIGELPRTPSLPLMGKFVIMEMIFCVISIFFTILLGLLDKVLKKFVNKFGITIVEAIIFLVVSLSNTITTILLFTIPQKRNPPTAYMEF